MSSKSSVQVDDARIPSCRQISGQTLLLLGRSAEVGTFFSFFPILTPISFSTRKQVMPLYPLLGSTFANTL